MRKIKILMLLIVLYCGQTVYAQVNPAQKIAAAIKAIQDNYVDSIKDEVLVDAAIQGLITRLDPHSQYMKAREATAMKQSMSGSFYGIGVVFIIQHDSVYISEVIEDGPAQKAGIKTGDKIIAIDGQTITTTENGQAAIMNKIRGANGSVVKLTIRRDQHTQPILLDVTRGPIPDRSVRAAFMVDKEVGYIALRIFNSTTRNEVDEALEMLIRKGMKNLILDLQGNGGGYVQAAFGVADEFLRKDQLVFYTKGHDNAEDYYYAAGTGRFPEGRLVVLIDEGTASASEILSGALQDWDRAVLVGRRSFGKGLMQKPVPLFDGSILELTGARYYTPSGRSIQKPYIGNHYVEEKGARWTSGELFNQQLIHFPDSLKKNTLQNQRIVYGGGGIMPDKYVVLNTLSNGQWFNSMGKSGIINEASFNYVNHNRQKLLADYGNFEQFQQSYSTPNTEIKALLKSAEKKGMKLSKKDQALLIPLLANEFKAQIAAQLFGNKAYQEILTRESTVFQKGLSIIRDQQAYQNILKPEKHP